nr:unnamed protein product [Haemonchus contortus]
MNIRIRTERMFDYLSAYIGKLAIKGNTEVQSELEQVERGIKAVTDKLTFDEELPKDSCLSEKTLLLGVVLQNP